MTYLNAIIMAFVQGLTEFLPVSSSGHMVLTKALLGVESPGALWEVALHVGTLVAVVTVFWSDLRKTVAGFFQGLARRRRGESWKTIWQARADFRMACYVLIATAAAAAVGIGLGDVLEGLFSKPVLSAIMIFVTGEILWLTKPYSMFGTDNEVRLASGLAIGAAQAGALMPGLSRSGFTIATAMIIGIDRGKAVRFSFLLSIPAILGASLLKTREFGDLPAEQIMPMITAVAVSAVSGYLALRLLLRAVKAGRLHCFAYYCWAVSVLGVTLLWALGY